MLIDVFTLRGPSNLSFGGGGRKYLKSILERFSNEGHNIKLNCGLERELPSEEDIGNIKVNRYNSKGFFLKNILKLKRNSHDSDLIIENVVSYPFCIPLFFRRKKRLIIFHHLSGSTILKTHGILHFIINFLIERLIIPIVYRKDKIVVPSNFTKRQLLKIGLKDDNIFICEPGLDIPLDKGVKSHDPSLLFIGKYRKNCHKKLDHLIYIFEDLKKDIPRLKLYIAGDVVLEDELTNIVNSDDNINLLGYITDEEKIELLKEAWLFVNPSLVEGFCIAWIEANACGTPSIGYDIEHLKTIEHGINGKVVTYNNSGALYNELKDLLLDKNYLKDLSDSSFLYAEKFNWDITYSKIKDILNAE